MRSRSVSRGLIIFSVLAVFFPEDIGLIFGLVIGVIIMTMEQIGLKMDNWGRELGGWIGNWAISLGEWMNNWAIGLAEIISNMNLLQSIQMLGLLMMFAGVFVIWFLPRYTRG